MAMSPKQRREVEAGIESALRRKMQDYRPEAMAKPFHTRLLGHDRMALFSFIHSLNTNFGTAIFEPVGEILAAGRFAVVKRQARIGNVIGEKADAAITNIVNEITVADRKPDAKAEFRVIQSAVREGGKTAKVKLRRADLWLEDSDGAIALVEMKTVKPNISSFEDHKRQLLRWIAAVLQERPDAQVSAMLALPYNPHAPKEYKWWTMQGMYDLQEQVKVAEGFWDFLAGEEVYDDLLDCFERVGKKMANDIDAYFERFQKRPE